MSRSMLGFSATVSQEVALVLIVLFVVVLALLPPMTFLVKGWPLKNKQILNYFDPGTIEFYFKTYWQNSPRIKYKRRYIELSNLKYDADDRLSAEKLLEALHALCYLYFGRALYLPPLLMLLLISLFSSFFVVLSGLFFSAKTFAGLPVQPPCILLSYTAMAGIAGAYLWVVGDGISRMRVNDYLPSDIYGHVIRFTIAIPLGLAFSSLGNGIGPFLAFAVGTFPLETITRFIRASAAKAVGAQDDPDTDGDEIRRISGVNNDVAHRLMSEDIATVLALANCDPIRVMMRTNLDFKVVLDIMDQAIVASELALSNVDNSNKILDVLRQSGMSKASKIRGLHSDLAGKLPALLNLDPDQVSNVISNIASDDRTLLVCKLKSPP